MPSTFIYVDESGDLGWKFDAPYRQGGSSRFLSIAGLCVTEDKKHLPGRTVRDLYDTFRWNPKKEKKWVDMAPGSRKSFVSRASSLCADNPEICYHAIVVRKENVAAHIRKDANKLYNWMIKQALMGFMATCANVTLVPDPRSIKVQSGNSLHDYLQTQLWFEEQCSTVLCTKPVASKDCVQLQFADMLAGVVQTHYEDNEAEAFNALSPCMTVTKLFF